MSTALDNCLPSVIRELPTGEFKVFVYLDSIANPQGLAAAGKAALASALGLSPAHVGRLTQRLIQKGHIERIDRAQYRIAILQPLAAEPPMEGASNQAKISTSPEDEPSTKAAPPEDQPKKSTKKPRRQHRRTQDFGAKPRAEWTTYDAANYFAASIEVKKPRLWGTVNALKFSSALNSWFDRWDGSVAEVLPIMDKYLNDRKALDRLDRDPKPINHFLQYLKDQPRKQAISPEYENTVRQMANEYLEA